MRFVASPHGGAMVAYVWLCHKRNLPRGTTYDAATASLTKSA